MQQKTKREDHTWQMCIIETCQLLVEGLVFQPLGSRVVPGQDANSHSRTLLFCF